MTTAHATVEVFLQAFRALSKTQRLEFLEELLRFKPYREDLRDLAIMEARRNEPSRSFREYLSERQAHRSHR